jgi:hypothetical protein
MPVSTHPDQDDDVLGPIDFLAIEFPGARITSPGFEQLLTVADQGIIRILDLERSANVLAAHSALPGPALVTPALRAMLRQPPELLLPPPRLILKASTPARTHPDQMRQAGAAAVVWISRHRITRKA